MQLKKYFCKITQGVLFGSAGILISLPAYSQICPFRASATSALLMEADSGEVVYSQSPHLRLQPASLAKIMTLFLIFDAIANGSVALDEEVVVSRQSAQKKGSTMYLREGEKTRLAELIKGIAVVSGNDACIAAAEKLSGGEEAFVNLMNRKAQALGMLNTRFQSVDGWPAEDQYTTTHDMAVLARAYIENHPQALDFHKLEEFSHADIVLHNRNRLILQDRTVDGLKTGHVEEAGFHLVATARRDGRRFIAVIMGAEDIDTREKEASQLLESGFDSHMTVKLFDRGDALFKLPVLNGVKKDVGLVPTEDGSVEVPLGHKKLVSYRIDAAAEPEAPVDLDQHLGNVLITYREEVVKKISLVATEKIERAPAHDADKDTEKPAALLETEKTKTGENINLPSTSVTQILAGQIFFLAPLAACLVLLIVQWIYIIKLRGRIAESSAADSELIKQRLKKIIE